MSGVGGDLGGCGESVGVHIADVGDVELLVRGEDLEVVRAHAATADEGNGDPVGLADGRRGGRDREGGGRGLEEGPARGHWRDSQ